MIKADKRSDLEKYSVWLKVNRQIEGPLFIISLSYILVYTLALILWTLRPEFFNPFLVYLGIGFLFFICAIYVAFTGFLLRSIK